MKEPITRMTTVLKPIRNERGFTLLELLVVVAILAIVAGGVVVAYDGLEKKAALQEASHGIGAIDDATRNFTTLRGVAPDNLDSLLAYDPAADTDQNVATAATGTVDLASLSDNVPVTGGNLAGKITPLALSAAQVTALNNAGITRLRYADVAGNSNACVAGVCALATVAANGTPASVGNIALADIPNRVFDVPREGANRNRGRGFSHTLAAADEVQMWNPGAGGIDLIKVGANPGGFLGTANTTYAACAAACDDADRLVAVGLGNNSTMFQVDGTVRGDAHLSVAPTYPDVLKTDYGRYLLLYNVGSVTAPLTKARLQAVVDAKGDFLDEELAEASGQKQ